MSKEQNAVYSFGLFRLDAASRVLTRSGEAVNLAPKTLDLLLVMVDSGGRLISKRELMQSLWPDTFVEEANLSFQISALRKAFEADGYQFIETVPKHGYRFTASVERLAATPAVSVAPGKRGLRLWIGAVAVLAGLLAGYAGWRRHQTAEPLRTTRLTSYPGSEITPALSPDGSQVAFAWDGPKRDNFDIYVKLAGPGEPIRLTTDPAPEALPAWSPDGRLIAFQRWLPEDRVAVYVKPALGGSERRIAEFVVGEQVTRTPYRHANLWWTPDGAAVAFGAQMKADEPAGIWVAAIDKAEVQRLTTVPPGARADMGPSFSPDGRYLAFVRVLAVSLSDLYVLRLHPPASKPVRIASEMRLILAPVWTPDGRALLYSSGGHLGTRVVKRLRLTDDRAASSAPETVPFGEQAAAISLSRGGRLVYSRENNVANIWRLDLGTGEQERLIASTLYDQMPSFSPDGRKIVFSSTRSGTEELWLCDANGANPVQLTFSGGPSTSDATFSADGRTILFSSRREGNSSIYVLDLGSGAVRRLTTDPADKVSSRWSSDGNSIYFTSTRSGAYEIWKMPSSDGPALQVTHGGGWLAQESLDAKVLFYAARHSLFRMPVSGGPAVKLVEDLTYYTNFAVGKTGIYYIGSGATQRECKLQFFDFRSSHVRTVANVGRPFWFGLALSPDQRFLLFSVLDQDDSDLVMVENVK